MSRMESMEPWQLEEKKRAEQLVNDLSRFVNSMSRSNNKYFVDAVMMEHRTLQQSMFGLFLGCVDEWAKKGPGHYDLRNEDTIRKSQKIVEALDNNLHVSFI